ncbi:hypothetical protein BT69DRAFT_772282 [Atractiella rhizophila]|nr:hypothetical protein BT69DRAFT_772282 [Atractiella rhizophila]
MSSNSLPKPSFRQLLIQSCGQTLRQLHIYVDPSTLQVIPTRVYVDFITSFSSTLEELSLNHQDESSLTAIAVGVLPMLSQLRSLNFSGIAPDFQHLSSASVESLFVNDEKGKHWHGSLVWSITSGNWPNLKSMHSSSKPTLLLKDVCSERDISYVVVPWSDEVDRRQYYTRVAKQV